MADGNVQLYLRKVLEREVWFTPGSQYLRNREVLPRRLIKWVEGFICCFFDGPSDSEEPKPLLDHDRIQIRLSDRGWNRGSAVHHLPFPKFARAEDPSREFGGCPSGDQKRDPADMDDVDPDTYYTHPQKSGALCVDEGGSE